MTEKKLMRIAEANTASAESVQRETVRVQRVMTVAFMVALMVSMFACSAFATGDAIQDGVKTGLGQVYGIMTAIVVPIAVIAVGFSAFKIFTGGEKGMQTAKTTILYTVIGIIIVYLAPVAIQQISTWITPDTSIFG